MKAKSPPHKNSAVLSLLDAQFDKGAQNVGDNQQPTIVAERTLKSAVA
jgi:hypothetical protein